jgi:hypothetical protein
MQYIQGVSKLNSKTSGMDSSYRRKKGYNMGRETYSYRVVRACICWAHADMSWMPDKMRNTGYNCCTSKQVTQEMHNYRVISPFSNSAIRASGRVVVHSVNTRSDNSVTTHFGTSVVIPFFSSLYMRNPIPKLCRRVFWYTLFTDRYFISSKILVQC